MSILGNNTAYVASRAKARKSNLMDRTRLRQLIQQSPDQLTVAVADSGYRAEIDLRTNQSPLCIRCLQRLQLVGQGIVESTVAALSYPLDWTYALSHEMLRKQCYSLVSTLFQLHHPNNV